MALGEDVAELLAGQAQVKGLELVSWVAPEVPARLQGDPIRLRQVLLNLVGNALKFTHRGEIALRVERVDEGVDGVALKFTIADTGVGFEPAAQARLFQPFSQADTSTTRRYGGTGLGLAICRRLVELMDGSIGLESAPGVGSTFWFTVRLGSGQEPTPVLAPDLRGLRVLVVDDNATNLLVLERLLARWGAECETVAGGLEALVRLEAAALAGRPWTVVLLDMQMPDLDGIQTARAIRARAHLAAVRLVMMTSWARQQLEADALAAGIALCLPKPVRAARLLEALRDVAVARTPPVARLLPT